ncbi:MAG: rod shape-determining protein MreD [Muribaculaceae bacterium]|jgi:rod shape-determining protein MreD|nr:rod shape-determining protein MreD [Muribaculaceae bacterium]
MTKTIVQFILLFLALMVLQLVCNKIILFNVAMPVVFIYLILRLPVNLHTGWVLTIAFVTGLVIDIFNNTPGMNALACTIVAAIRRPVFNTFVSRENDMNIPIPSVDSMGVGDYFKYMATIVTIYCALVFLIQAFTLHNILLTLARIAASSVLSIIIIFGLDTLVSTRREKRL